MRTWTSRENEKSKRFPRVACGKLERAVKEAGGAAAGTGGEEVGEGEMHVNNLHSDEPIVLTRLRVWDRATVPIIMALVVRAKSSSDALLVEVGRYCWRCSLFHGPLAVARRSEGRERVPSAARV